MADFILKLGATIDLAQYLRVDPADGFDPVDADYAEIAFADSPLGEGGVRLAENAGLREMVWPLSLRAATKPALLALVRDINRILQQQGQMVEWRDAGLTQSTFYDIAGGRLEPAFNHRLGVHNWLKATLRVWCQPFGHTATARIVATAAGTSPLMEFSLTSEGLEGDAPAQMDARVYVPPGATLAHRIVAVSVLPHPSYLAHFAAASIRPSASTVATLVGASGAPGSQYLGFLASQLGGNRRAFVTLPIPSMYVGAHRVFGMVRGAATPAHHTQMLWGDGADLAYGPTAVASYDPQGWQLVDFGTVRFATSIPPRDSESIVFYARPASASGWTNPTSAQYTGSHTFQLSEVYILPEHRTTLLVDNVELSSNAAWRFDGRSGEVYRAASPGSVTAAARLTGRTRGHIPQLPAPSAARMAVLNAPFKAGWATWGGAANEVTSVEIRAVERFRFAR